MEGMQGMEEIGMDLALLSRPHAADFDAAGSLEMRDYIYGLSIEPDAN
jgi:hypothetical protein